VNIGEIVRSPTCGDGAAWFVDPAWTQTLRPPATPWKPRTNVTFLIWGSQVQILPGSPGFPGGLLGLLWTANNLANRPASYANLLTTGAWKASKVQGD